MVTTEIRVDVLWAELNKLSEAYQMQLDLQKNWNAEPKSPARSAALNQINESLVQIMCDAEHISIQLENLGL